MYIWTEKKWKKRKRLRQIITKDKNLTPKITFNILNIEFHALEANWNLEYDYELVISIVFEFKRAKKKWKNVPSAVDKPAISFIFPKE